MVPSASLNLETQVRRLRNLRFWKKPMSGVRSASISVAGILCVRPWLPLNTWLPSTTLKSR